MRRLFTVLAVLCISNSVFAKTRGVEHASALPTPRSVLWVAAHPDDESLAAPLLSKWCREDHASCTFLVFTRGQQGDCVRAGGCLPDIASVRSSEEGAASQYFNASLVLLTLPDGGGAVPPSWHDDPNLISTIAGYIDAIHPDLVLTFDPRHGTTCHPDHRAAADIVLEATNRLSFKPAVYLLETRLAIVSGPPISLVFSSASATASRYDANESWDAVIADMERHSSQFDSQFITAARAVPESERAVYIAP